MAGSGKNRQPVRMVVVTGLDTKTALRDAGELTDLETAPPDTPGAGMDLDQALATLPPAVRLCIVLSYHEGMTHDEIADFTSLPVGTVKSHIRRGTKKLQQELKEYL